MARRTASSMPLGAETVTADQAGPDTRETRSRRATQGLMGSSVGARARQFNRAGGERSTPGLLAQRCQAWGQEPYEPDWFSSMPLPGMGFRTPVPEMALA